MKKTIRGIIPPMITPLLGKDTLDLKGLEKLIEHILKGGVHGLFILGTTGEGPSLSYRIRYELIEKTCKQVNGRVPVFVGITDTSFTESVKMANISKQYGAEAVVLAPPYYFPAGKDELQEYLSDIIKEIDLPVYLYNMPSHTKMNIELETVLEIAKMPGVHGIKDSSGNMIYFHNIVHTLKNKKDFSFLIGPEQILAESLLLGADGGVSGGANFYPELYVGLFNAAQEKNWEKVRQLHNKIMDISTTIYSVGRFGSSYLKGIKTSLFHLGICSDFMAEPFHSFKQAQKDKIKVYLEKMGFFQ